MCVRVHLSVCACVHACLHLCSGVCVCGWVGGWVGVCTFPVFSNMDNVVAVVYTYFFEVLTLFK